MKSFNVGDKIKRISHFEPHFKDTESVFTVIRVERHGRFVDLKEMARLQGAEGLCQWASENFELVTATMNFSYSSNEDHIHIDLHEDSKDSSKELAGLFAMKSITFTGTNLIECVQELVKKLDQAQSIEASRNFRINQLEDLVDKTINDLTYAKNKRSTW